VGEVVVVGNDVAVGRGAEKAEVGDAQALEVAAQVVVQDADAGDGTTEGQGRRAPAGGLDGVVLEQAAGDAHGENAEGVVVEVVVGEGQVDVGAGGGGGEDDRVVGGVVAELVVVDGQAIGRFGVDTGAAGGPGLVVAGDQVPLDRRRPVRAGEDA